MEHMSEIQIYIGPKNMAVQPVAIHWELQHRRDTIKVIPPWLKVKTDRTVHPDGHPQGG